MRPASQGPDARIPAAMNDGTASRRFGRSYPLSTLILTVGKKSSYCDRSRRPPSFQWVEPVAFVPLHLLPAFDRDKAQRYRSRWETDEGRRLADDLRIRIRNGAGEDFLLRDLQAGYLGFLENENDLKGIELFKEDIEFPADEDNFEAIDLSYARIWHSKFHNGQFSGSFAFSRLYNVEFVGCHFSFVSFYGAELTGVRFVDCEFGEQVRFVNADVKESAFVRCRLHDTPFSSCRFDISTRLENTDVPSPPERVRLLSSIKEAFSAGGCHTESRDYFFREMHVATRLGGRCRREFWLGLMAEYVAGYGVRPGRTMLTMLGVLLLAWVVFGIRTDSSTGLMIAAGALFTFGAFANDVLAFGLPYAAFYVAVSFAGVALAGTLVTVWANRWLRER